MCVCGRGIVLKDLDHLMAMAGALVWWCRRGGDLGSIGPPGGHDDGAGGRVIVVGGCDGEGGGLAMIEVDLVVSGVVATAMVVVLR